MLVTSKFDRTEGEKLKKVISRIPNKDDILKAEAIMQEQVEKFDCTLKLI